ncbi:MAG: acetylxylan esterase [Bacteroidota bacterium]
MNRYSVILFIAILVSIYTTGQEKKYSVFHSNQGEDATWLAYSNNQEALYKTISEEAYRLLDKRTNKIATIEGKEQWLAYRENLRDKMFSSLDKFEKTPLNARITGTIERESYTVEKILFESHPGFFVTGCLFIPKERQEPAPAVIYCSGHTELAFRSETYQNVILNLVAKGFIVFGLDPIGQGERLQYLDTETGKSKIGGPTKEHTFAGVQTLFTGTSLTDYFIWDGVRTVDYLLTRKEADPKRIGITGRSGGGTQSAMIAAYDQRIFAAAPECYITNFKRLLQSIGPQDAEQNPFNAIKLGFDHPDFFHLRAPKPSIIITTTHDFFSQQGARETFKEVQKSYEAFGSLGNIQMVESFGKHESTKQNREALYAFFQHHLNNPGNSSEIETKLFQPEELWVTQTGQIQSSFKGKTTFQLNQKYSTKTKLPPERMKEKIRKLSGIKFDMRLTSAVYTGKIVAETFDIEKYFLENDKNEYALPVLMLKKQNTNSEKYLVWLNSEGKKYILNSGLAKEFIKEGYTIITADLPGMGELYDKEFSGDGYIRGVPFNYTFGAHLAGKSIPGITAEALDLLMQFVTKINKQNNNTFALVDNEMASPFLHFTTFKNPFFKIQLVNPPELNAKFLETEYYNPKLAYWIVPGSLNYYDLESLISFLPDETVNISHTNDSEIKPINSTVLKFFKESLPE